MRATNVYGPGQQLFKIIPRSIIYLTLGKTIPLHGGGEAVKSYIHIRDISHGELAVLERGEIGKMYHLSPDAGVAVKDVVRTICETLGQAFETMTETVGERIGQDAAYVIDSTRARNELGWQPQISFPDGIAETVDWVRTYWDEIQQQPLEYQHKP